jgi:hypothetical protein
MSRMPNDHNPPGGIATRLVSFSADSAVPPGVGQTALLSFWTRPLHAMTDAFATAGFWISAISEPAVAPDTPRELLPDNLADRRRFACFLFFVLEAV